MGHFVICSPELHNSDMTKYNCKLFFVFMLVISTFTTAAKADVSSTTVPPTQPSPTTDPSPTGSSDSTPKVTTTTPAATTTTSGVPSTSAPLSVLATVMM